MGKRLGCYALGTMLLAAPSAVAERPPEIAAATARVEQAQEALKDARRDLRDAMAYDNAGRYDRSQLTKAEKRSERQYFSKMKAEQIKKLREKLATIRK